MSTEEFGTVLSFPIGGKEGLHAIPKPVCSDCENAYFGSRGIFCAEFNEPIHFEDVAEDCEMFDPILSPDVA